MERDLGIMEERTMFLNSDIVQRMTRERVEDRLRRAEKSRLAYKFRIGSRQASGQDEGDAGKDGDTLPSDVFDPSGRTSPADGV